MFLAVLISSMISSNDCILLSVPKMGHTVKSGHWKLSLVEVANVVCSAFKRNINWIIHHPKTIQRPIITRYLSLNFMVFLSKRYSCHWTSWKVEMTDNEHKTVVPLANRDRNVDNWTWWVIHGLRGHRGQNIFFSFYWKFATILQRSEHFERNDQRRRIAELLW